MVPAERAGVEYEEQAVNRALELTQGYPFYLQEFGKHIWNLAPGSPVTIQNVDDALPRAEESLDRGIYEVRIQRATAKERRYLRAMAERATSIVPRCGPDSILRWPARACLQVWTGPAAPLLQTCDPDYPRPILVTYVGGWDRQRKLEVSGVISPANARFM